VDGKHRPKHGVEKKLERINKIHYFLEHLLVVLQTATTRRHIPQDMNLRHHRYNFASCLLMAVSM
jgi:hypothetical protein